MGLRGPKPKGAAYRGNYGSSRRGSKPDASPPKRVSEPEKRQQEMRERAAAAGGGTPVAATPGRRSGRKAALLALDAAQQLQGPASVPADVLVISLRQEPLKGDLEVVMSKRATAEPGDATSDDNRREAPVPLAAEGAAG